MLTTSGKIKQLKIKGNNVRDLVTESDIACQDIIKDIVRRTFPTDLFLGEEDVGAGSDASREALTRVFQTSFSLKGDDEDKKKDDKSKEEKLLWVVDPIDGTTNFQAGLPLFCVSIGVVDPINKKVLVGVIYNPSLDELTTAVRGHGCYLNSQPLFPSPHKQRDQTENTPILLSTALVNIGFPVSTPNTLKASSCAVSILSTRVRGVRMIASASQAMAWVAHGKLSGYLSWDLNSWDVAAGIVIVEEAGGAVLDFRGKEVEGVLLGARDLMVCAPGYINVGREVLQILGESGCLEY